MTTLGDKGEYEQRMTRAQVRVGSLKTYFVKKFNIDASRISTEEQIEPWVTINSKKVSITDKNVFVRIEFGKNNKLVAISDWYDQEMMLQASKQLQIGRQDDLDKDGIRNELIFVKIQFQVF